MKTSNLILTIGVTLALGSSLATLGIAIAGSKQTTEQLRPLAQQIDTTAIHVIKVAHPENEVVVKQTKKTKLVSLDNCPSVEDFAVVGDTLVVYTAPSKIPMEISLPDVTHIITADGTVILSSIEE
ncbi:MAG: hypothetical protein IIX00_00470 [Tidjanibacter sp.]|nr:hypothetical protein [Tidjanibacter sp.]